MNIIYILNLQMYTFDFNIILILNYNIFKFALNVLNCKVFITIIFYLKIW